MYQKKPDKYQDSNPLRCDAILIYAAAWLKLPNTVQASFSCRNNIKVTVMWLSVLTKNWPNIKITVLWDGMPYYVSVTHTTSTFRSVSWR